MPVLCGTHIRNENILQLEQVQRRAAGAVPLLQRLTTPTARYSDGPLFRQPVIPTAHYSDGPFFRQCKIELNPQIHGLTRCIQQDGPSV